VLTQLFSLGRTFADLDDLLLVTPSLESYEALESSGGKDLLNFLGDISDMILVREVKVFLHLAVWHHEEASAILVDVNGGDFSLDDDGSWDHIASTEGLLVLLVREDVLGGDHGLGGSVLAGLGSVEGGDLAGEDALLHHDEGTRLHAASFSEFGVKRTSITLFEIVVRGHSLVV